MLGEFVDSLKALCDIRIKNVNIRVIMVGICRRVLTCMLACVYVCVFNHTHIYQPIYTLTHMADRQAGRKADTRTGRQMNRLMSIVEQEHWYKSNEK